jgi:hypothetical protein
LSIIVDSPNLTGWLIKMISAEDMFERIDHWANNAMPITEKSNKVKVLSVQLPNRYYYSDEYYKND